MLVRSMNYPCFSCLSRFQRSGIAVLVFLCLVQSAAAQPRRSSPLALGTNLADLRNDAKKAGPGLAKIYDSILQATKDEEGFAAKALEQVNTLLAKKEMPAVQKLTAAQKILVAVLNWQRAKRVTAAAVQPRSEIEIRLANRLLFVRHAYLRELAKQASDKNRWDRVFAFVADMQRAYPQTQSVRIQAGSVYLQRAEALVKEKEFRRVHDMLPKIRRLLPLHPRTQKLEQSLEMTARKLQKQAESVKDKDEAIAFLEKAQAIWPTLPGLRDQLLKQRGQYSILWVAVPQLPEKMSPATARTIVEKLAVELLFESLLRPDYEADAGQRYEAELAAQAPEVLSQSRRFLLPADARWSNGKPITLLDIRHTAELLLQAHTDQGAIWTEIVKRPRQVGELLQAEFALRHPTFDPLAFFTFRILPRTYRRKSLLSASEEDFARAPVGSGPYIYRGRKKANGRLFAQFTANPYYARADRPRQPYIREIRFFVPDLQAISKDNSDPPIHLWLDLTAEQMALAKEVTPLRFNTIRTPRVYFLAVNHRRPILGNRDFRRGLANAIDREKALDVCFRANDPALKDVDATGAGLGAAAAFLGTAGVQAHQRLNGLFPAGCWAMAPAVRVPEKLFDSEKARLYFGRVAKDQKRIVLTLKYPQEDARVRAACRMLAAQIEKAAAEVELQLRIQRMPLPAGEFYRDIENRNYDLAYYHRDYESEFYWLWPLFDPHPEALAKGGSNFLGYENDGALVKLLHERLSSVDFEKVRKLSHDIHGHLHHRMPLIPLWQLDMHVGIHPDLRTVDLHGPRLLSRMARWTMRAK